MIPTLLPATAVAADAYEREWETELLQPEQAAVAFAVEHRRREFAAGRGCARRALAALGWPSFPLLVGERREPVWPPDVVGSITHSAGYCAAAVARTTDLESLGIDAERNVAISSDVLSRICSSEEVEAIPAQGFDPGTLIFSAKEATYKAWYQLTARWLDYLDALVSVDVERRMFRIRACTPLADAHLLEQFRGQFGYTREHVFTAVTVEHR